MAYHNRCYFKIGIHACCYFTANTCCPYKTSSWYVTSLESFSGATDVWYDSREVGLILASAREVVCLRVNFTSLEPKTKLNQRLSSHPKIKPNQRLSSSKTKLYQHLSSIETIPSLHLSSSKIKLYYHLSSHKTIPSQHLSSHKTVRSLHLQASYTNVSLIKITRHRRMKHRGAISFKIGLDLRLVIGFGHLTMLIIPYTRPSALGMLDPY